MRSKAMKMLCMRRAWFLLMAATVLISISCRKEDQRLSQEGVQERMERYEREQKHKPEAEIKGPKLVLNLKGQFDDDDLRGMGLTISGGKAWAVPSAGQLMTHCIIRSNVVGDPYIYGTVTWGGIHQGTRAVFLENVAIALTGEQEQVMLQRRDDRLWYAMFVMGGTLDTSTGRVTPPAPVLRPMVEGQLRDIDIPFASNWVRLELRSIGGSPNSVHVSSREHVHFRPQGSLLNLELSSDRDWDYEVHNVTFQSTMFGGTGYFDLATTPLGAGGPKFNFDYNILEREWGYEVPLEHPVVVRAHSTLPYRYLLWVAHTGIAPGAGTFDGHPVNGYTKVHVKCKNGTKLRFFKTTYPGQTRQIKWGKMYGMSVRIAALERPKIPLSVEYMAERNLVGLYSTLNPRVGANPTLYTQIGGDLFRNGSDLYGFEEMCFYKSSESRWINANEAVRKARQDYDIPGTAEWQSIFGKAQFSTPGYRNYMVNPQWGAGAVERELKINDERAPAIGGAVGTHDGREYKSWYYTPAGGTSVYAMRYQYQPSSEYFSAWRYRLLNHPDDPVHSRYLEISVRWLPAWYEGYPDAQGWWDAVRSEEFWGEPFEGEIRRALPFTGYVPSLDLHNRHNPIPDAMREGTPYQLYYWTKNGNGHDAYFYPNVFCIHQNSSGMSFFQKAIIRSGDSAWEHNGTYYQKSPAYAIRPFLKDNPWAIAYQ